jgi:CRP-like cAMP-binding protein
LSDPECAATTDGLLALEATILLQAGRMRTMPALSPLCQEGQVTDLCFVVTAGKVEIAKMIAGKKRPLSTSGPGSVLALMAVLDGAPCSVSMQTLADVTVVEITRKSLLALLDVERNPDPAVAHRLALLGIRHLRGATDDLARALCRALGSQDQAGHFAPLELARIQARTNAWATAE